MPGGKLLNSLVLFVDIKKKVDEKKTLDLLVNQPEGTIYISLSPYSCYLLDHLEIKYLTFHSFLSETKFRDNVLGVLSQIDALLTGPYVAAGMEFVKLISVREYKKNIAAIYNQYQGSDVLYVHNYLELSRSHAFSILKERGAKHLFIGIKDESEDLVPNRKGFLSLFTLNFLKRILSRIIGVDSSYDWPFFFGSVYRYSKIKFKNNTTINEEGLTSSELKSAVEGILKESNPELDQIFDLVEKYTKDRKDYKRVTFQTWGSLKDCIYASNNFGIFYQHGNYFYKNLILKYCEIFPASVNFVFNDYTKKQFEEMGATNVYSVGSLVLNKKIKNRNLEFDFVFITQFHDYLAELQYVDFDNSCHSFDGHNLYKKHKAIIALFGERFRDKRILIKVHPAILNSASYVPYWELSNEYDNIVIDISMPMENAIGISKYIISDYFTTTFINRDLHYQRDIIMFDGSPTPMPENTREDMNKMFILVNSVEELADKIENIEKICEHRIRDDAVIEYYSSKKCNTKARVKKILLEEMKKIERIKG